ncbi:hypothetical protein NDU88_004036 [Pleurodeles waltl]|uniref:Uncharacterized protein n=1 Tax=Pleurodeles waltl TaxID=8319 RepID=A0AAV7VF50_PLEWA|nr:hypothetical protein NDU88_004036 [Pleurodeles waltl]
MDSWVVILRLTSATAPESEWRYSRGREIGATHCHDDRGPGVSDVTPDFQVRVTEKGEDGRMQVPRESDTAVLQMTKPTETANEDQEESKRSAGTTDGSRNMGGTENPEPSEETLNSRHVPGGAWLTKVRSLLRDSKFLNREKGDRRGEGRDSGRGAG